MNERELQKILEAVHSGEVSSARALERLKHLPFEDLDFAKVDHHRALRQGYAEVIFGKGKTPEQVAEIVRSMLRHKDGRQNILVTRTPRFLRPCADSILEKHPGRRPENSQEPDSTPCLA
jgi:NCAIR mutase (PurE)-related protein